LTSVLIVEGRRVLLHMMAGSKEDAETVTAFFEYMKSRRAHEAGARPRWRRTFGTTVAPT
jgi:hypothetical protein